MNKQEAIERINILKELSHGALGGDWIELGIDKALDVVKQLDDAVKPPKPKPLVPEKPVVPQFVADWYEENKYNFDKNLFEFIYCVVSCYTINEKDDFEELTRLTEDWMSNNLKRWMSMACDNGAITTLVNMHQFGYEVEKEKLYTVEIPNPNGGERPILFKNRDGKVSVVFASNPCWRTVKGAQLTEAEIKEYFGWAWQFAKEVKE